MLEIEYSSMQISSENKRKALLNYKVDGLGIIEAVLGPERLTELSNEASRIEELFIQGRLDLAQVSYRPRVGGGGDLREG